MYKWFLIFPSLLILIINYQYWLWKPLWSIVCKSAYQVYVKCTMCRYVSEMGHTCLLPGNAWIKRGLLKTVIVGTGTDSKCLLTVLATLDTPKSNQCLVEQLQTTVTSMFLLFGVQSPFWTTLSEFWALTNPTCVISTVPPSSYCPQ